MTNSETPIGGLKTLEYDALQLTKHDTTAQLPEHDTAKDAPERISAGDSPELSIGRDAPELTLRNSWDAPEVPTTRSLAISRTPYDLEAIKDKIISKYSRRMILFPALGLIVVFAGLTALGVWAGITENSGRDSTVDNSSKNTTSKWNR